MNHVRAVAAVLYFLSHGRPQPPGRLALRLYLAERLALERLGRSLFGEPVTLTPRGPRLETACHALRKLPPGTPWEACLRKTEGGAVDARRVPNRARLNLSWHEDAILAATMQETRGWRTRDLARRVRNLPESQPPPTRPFMLPYRRFLEHIYGRGDDSAAIIAARLEHDQALESAGVHVPR